MAHESAEPIRIVIVADGDPRKASTNSGVARGLLTALERRSDVAVIGTVSSLPSPLLRGINVILSYRLDRVQWRNNSRKGPFSTFARSFVRDRALRRFRIKPDVVIHIRNTYRPARFPYVSFVDGTSTLSQKGWAEWSLPSASHARRVADEKRQFDNAVAVYTAGEHVAREIITEYGQPPEKVRAVGGGINFDLKERYSDANRVEGRISILFIGMDFHRKGGDTLIEAFQALRARHSEVFLTIVGPTDLDPKFTSIPGVNLLGRVSDRTAISALYEAADIFCLPSVFEPYGLVIHEAMAHGATCVVSDVGALPELVAYGESGISVKAGDVGELLKALEQLVNEPELRRRMAQRAWSALPAFTWDAVAERLVTHLRRRASAH